MYRNDVSAGSGPGSNDARVAAGEEKPAGGESDARAHRSACIDSTYIDALNRGEISADAS